MQKIYIKNNKNGIIADLIPKEFPSIKVFLCV